MRRDSNITMYMSDLQFCYPHPTPFVESTLTPKIAPAILVLTSLILRNSSFSLSCNLAPCTIPILTLDLSLQLMHSMCPPEVLKPGSTSELLGKLLGNYSVSGDISRNSGLVYPLDCSGINSLKSFPQWPWWVTSLWHYVSDLSLWVR